MVPYIHDLGERLKKTCNNLGIQVHFKGNNTIKTLLMAPRTGTTNFKKVGSHIDISAHTSTVWRNNRGIGQNLWGQAQGTPQGPIPIHHHSHSIGHPVSPKCSTIVDRKPQEVTRNIKEAMYIHVNDPSLNRNLGKYQIPHIWDEVLQDTPSLCLK